MCKTAPFILLLIYLPSSNPRGKFNLPTTCNPRDTRPSSGKLTVMACTSPHSTKQLRPQTSQVPIRQQVPPPSSTIYMIPDAVIVWTIQVNSHPISDCNCLTYPGLWLYASIFSVVQCETVGGQDPCPLRQRQVLTDPFCSHQCHSGSLSCKRSTSSSIVAIHKFSVRLYWASSCILLSSRLLVT